MHYRCGSNLNSRNQSGPQMLRAPLAHAEDPVRSVRVALPELARHLSGLFGKQARVGALASAVDAVTPLMECPDDLNPRVLQRARPLADFLVHSHPARSPH